MDFTPEQAHAAKVAISGAFGASVLVFLRHPGSLIKAFAMVAIGTGIASIFYGYVTSITGLGEIQSAALLGMGGLVAAGKVLEALEQIDAKRFIKRKGP